MKTLLMIVLIVLTAAAAGAQPPQGAQPIRRVAETQTWMIGDQAVVSTGTLSVRLGVENKLVKGAPYSAEVETESVQALADGNRIVRKTTGRVFRDSQGRIRREEDRGTGQPSVTIFDPVADVTYTLDPERRIAFKSNAVVAVNVLREVEKSAAALEERRAKIDKAGQAADAAKADAAKVEVAKIEAAGRGGRGGGGGGARGGFAGGTTGAPRGRGRSMNEQRDEVLPATTIEGVRAQGTRHTTTIPANTIGNELPIAVVSEEWTSPELQVFVMTKHSDPRVGETTYRMRSINRSEPFASLFQVPADYTVRESEFRRR